MAYSQDEELKTPRIIGSIQLINQSINRLQTPGEAGGNKPDNQAINLTNESTNLPSSDT